MTFSSLENGTATAASPSCLPKLIGADVELGNFILGLELPHGTGPVASRLLLRQIGGFPVNSTWSSEASNESSQVSGKSEHNPQDWGRKYQRSNGGCVYIDLDHLELCPPETLSARDHAAAFHAMLRLARAAVRAANTRMPDGLKVVAVANNSDGHGNSYGSHLSFLVTRKAWDNIFCRRMHYLLFLASYQVSSIVFTGQGKVGVEKGASDEGHIPFQLSQRADYFECLTGVQTTYDRPIVNSRDEALCGRFTGAESPSDTMARLHSIFYDSTLCPASIVLRAGVMQIILCLIEAGEADLQWILEDPVEAVKRWSRDPSLQARARLLSGGEVTAVELQLRFLETASRFVERGGCDGLVPHAREIIALWADTLDKLRRDDRSALASRLDWVLKLSILQHALQEHRELTWASPEIKHLDFMYGNLDEGLYWAYEQGGVVERAGVTEERIRHFTQEPPEDTRAWTRAALLRRAEPQMIDSVDWDEITFKLRDHDGWSKYRTVRLADPLGFTRAQKEEVFQPSTTMDEVLDRLGAPQRDRTFSSSSSCRDDDRDRKDRSPHYLLPGRSSDAEADDHRTQKGSP